MYVCMYVCMYACMYVCMYVCQQAFSLLKIGFQRPPGFESYSQQRKTTCLLSIRKSLACARASKLTTTNMYIARARCECQMAVGSGGLNACWSWGRAVEFKFLAWSSVAQLVCQQAFSLLKIGFQRPPGFESCSQQRKTTYLLSIRKSLACARASKLTTCMYVCMYVCVYVCMYVCMYVCVGLYAFPCARASKLKKKRPVQSYSKHYDNEVIPNDFYDLSKVKR